MVERRCNGSRDELAVYLEMEGVQRYDSATVEDLLAETVRRLRGQLRSCDTAGRYGPGVLAVLAGVHAKRGRAVAERLIEAISADPVPTPRGDVRVHLDVRRVSGRPA